jgi:glycosyltransferase involved in cell wall biosynthesis
LLEGYEHRFLANRARRPDVDHFFGIDVPELAGEWEREGFDAALVLGWQSRGHLQAMRAARRLGIPCLVRGDSHLGMRPPSSLRAALRRLLWLPAREMIYRRMFAAIDGFLAVGKRNADFYAHFGVPAERIWLAPHCVDNTQFDLAAERGARVRAEHRTRLGVGDEVVFASVAKLLPRKRPYDLLDAFARLAASGIKAHLAFVGDGPERAGLEHRVTALGLADRVTIVGFVNQREIPSWLAAADCLVLPSDSLETWGLAVNEAMAAGLPVIVSDAVGCAPDLVVEGVNGYTFPLGDVEALHDRLSRVASATLAQRTAMGAASKGLIASCTFRRLGDTLLAALDDIAVRREARR